MRGDLHDAGNVARVEHLAERVLQVDGLRGRPHDLMLCSTDHGLDRAQETGLPPVGLEQRADQERGRGLAVGSRHADGLQTVCRIILEGSRRGSHRRPHRGNADLCHAAIQIPLHHQCHCAARNRLGREVVPIPREAGYAEEQGAGRDLGRGVREVGYLG